METLRSVRKRMGLAQYELSGLARIAVSELYRVERRGMRLTRQQAARIVKVLHVDPSGVVELQAAMPEDSVRADSRQLIEGVPADGSQLP